jgi:hypothetical protein
MKRNRTNHRFTKQDKIERCRALAMHPKFRDTPYLAVYDLCRAMGWDASEVVREVSRHDSGTRFPE